jgi:hypothetical protein
MRHILFSVALSALFLTGFTQVPSSEVFENHMTDLAGNKVLNKTFILEDEESVRHLYIDLGCYDEYFSQEPVEIPGHKIYLWKQGNMYFFDVELWLDLLKIRYQEDEVTIYEFVAQVEQKKFFFEAKFVFRYQKWELAEVRRTRIKTTR